MKISINDIIGKEYKENKDIIKSIEEDSYNEYNIMSENPKGWATRKNIWTAVDSFKNTLNASVYSTHITMDGEPFLLEKTINTDNLIELPDDKTTEIIAHIKDLWNREDRFRNLGFMFKRGILLYGPPGTGKTTLLFRVMKLITEKNAVVLLANSPYALSACLEEVRKVEKSRPIIVMMEDIDDIIYRYGDKSLTSILDGENSVDNVVYIATTNYPERLPARILNRPSRFDVIEEISYPSLSARTAYIQAVANGILSPTEISTIASSTEEMTIAQIKEVIILVYVFEKSVVEAVNSVRNIGKLM